MKTNNENRQRNVNFEPDNNRKKTFGNDYNSSSNRSGNSFSRERNNENSNDYKSSSYNNRSGNSFSRERSNENSNDRNSSSYNNRSGNSFSRERSNDNSSDRNSSSYNNRSGNSYSRERGNGNSTDRNSSSYNNRSGNSYSRERSGENSNDRNSSSYNNRSGNSFSRERSNDNNYNRNSSSYNNRPGNSYSRERSGENSNDSNNSSYPRSGRKRFSVNPASESNSSNYKETRFEDNYDKKIVFRARKNSDGYDPNSKYSKKKQTTYIKNNVDPTKPVRLNKFLANAGICSRREADEYIKVGVVSVNGEIVTELGVKILPTDKVLFHNEAVRTERKVYILLNKPKDTVTTTEDTHGRYTVLDIVKHVCSERVYPVGRLDRNTTGVLLLTNDGDLASKLTHPKFEKKKIYHVVLDRDLEQSDFEQVLAGVDLEDFTIAADALSYVKEDSGREVGIEIHTGQNRVVRRIFEKLGYKIFRLDRVYFAGLTKKNLPRGKCRFLSEKEVNMLRMGAFQ